MVKKLLSLKEISEYYDTYYFDQWGVVHDGINIFNEAEQVFSYLQSLNKKIYIISNSGKKSSDNTNRLIKMGAKNILKSHLITSGDVLSLIHISEPTRLSAISYAVFCL